MEEERKTLGDIRERRGQIIGELVAIQMKLGGTLEEGEGDVLTERNGELILELSNLNKREGEIMRDVTKRHCEEAQAQRETPEAGEGSNVEAETPIKIADIPIKIEHAVGKGEGAKKARKLDTDNVLKSIPRPERFRDGKNFGRFLRRFTQYVKLGNMDNGENLNLLLLSYIDHDETYEKLARVKLSDEETGDIDLLAKRFEQEIYPSIASQTLKSELQILAQKNDETAESFAFRINEIAQKAYKNREIRDESALTVFIRGCRDPSIKAKILDSETISFDLAVKIATKWEKINAVIKNGEAEEENSALFRIQHSPLEHDQTGAQAAHHVNNYGAGHGVQNTNRYTPNTNHQYGRGGGQVWGGRGSSLNNGGGGQGNRRPFVCFNCGQEGHRIAFCPQRASNNGQSGGRRMENGRNYASQQGGQGGRGPMICWGCGEPGHTVAMCTQRTGSSGVGRGRQIICFNCQQPGHIANFCPLRRFGGGGSTQVNNEVGRENNGGRTGTGNQGGGEPRGASAGGQGGPNTQAPLNC